VSQQDSSHSRRAQYPVNELFVSRWSHRALSGERIPDEVLFSAFEAARWAPSANNAQPWRFIYAKRDEAAWPQFLQLLSERNQAWASRASALVLILSLKERETAEGIKAIRSHSFDAGAAWSAFAHQAALDGWSTRAIGGYAIEATRTALQIPAQFNTEAFIAIGKATDKSVLREDFQALEKASDRQALSSLVAQGQFSFSA
jgi:nitroreductase